MEVERQRIMFMGKELGNTTVSTIIKHEYLFLLLLFFLSLLLSIHRKLAIVALMIPR